MKKIIAIALLLSMALSLTACSVGSSLPTTTQPENVPTKTIYVLAKQTTTHYVGEEVTDQYSFENTYDEKGFLAKQLWARSDGVVIEMEVENDEYGRVIRMSQTVNDETAVVEYTYDAYGNTASTVRTSNGVVISNEKYTYDADGNILVEERTYRGGDVSSSKRIYENGRLVKTEMYSGEELNQIDVYEYNDQGQITARKTCTEKGVVLATYLYTYSDDGRTTTITNEKWRLSTSTTVDEHGNVIRTESKDAGGGTIIEYTYIAIEIPENYPRKS
ncbi:MAG: hypothetical protein E7438_03900 [Ruminococcaceae bacterium]|nr:hypothetical protein [Oscillospiraceae bacterium]